MQQKLAILADAAKYDASCASSGSNRKRPRNGLGNGHSVGICHSYTPDGRCISLLKLLLTNFCIYDCQYCINRASSSTRRAAFKTDEIVSLTVEFYKRNYIEGLFVSSGIMVSPDYTMERLIAIAKKLRTEHRFGGYIHIKAVPGASQELMDEAGIWADRLSANIELPTQDDLNNLAPEKTHQEIEGTMGQIRTAIDRDKKERGSSKHRRRYAAGGQSTQLIVGATPTPDMTILQKASDLYQGYKLRRVYYSAYSPIPDMSSQMPSTRIPLLREHRLYQADWLLRFYGFTVEELVTGQDRNLDLKQDPKMVWALAHPEYFPVDINTAPRAMLMRVPGIGVRNAMRIQKIRKYHRLRLKDLRKLRVALNRARRFILAEDHWPDERPIPVINTKPTVDTVQDQQLDFFSALTGEI